MSSLFALAEKPGMVVDRVVVYKGERSLGLQSMC